MEHTEKEFMHLLTRNYKRYVVDLKTGNISYGNFPFSGGWKFVSFRGRLRNMWIRLDEIVKNPAVLDTVRWTYKNGSPMFTVRDLDHGTTREWGDAVISVSLSDRR